MNPPSQQLTDEIFCRRCESAQKRSEYPHKLSFPLNVPNPTRGNFFFLEAFSNFCRAGARQYQIRKQAKDNRSCEPITFPTTL